MALAATSGLGAYLIFKTVVYPAKSRRQSNHKENDKKSKHEGPFDFVLDGNSNNNEPAMTDVSESTCSTQEEEEIQQVWQDDRDVNLKILKHIMQQKEASRQRGVRPYSRLSLFSHLAVNKLIVMFGL
jgi:hypothetical protein